MQCFILLAGNAPPRSERWDGVRVKSPLHLAVPLVLKIPMYTNGSMTGLQGKEWNIMKRNILVALLS